VAALSVATRKVMSLMNVIPAVRAVRYEHLEPSELFLFIERAQSTYALKVRRQGDGDRNRMVVLGPSFLDAGGPFLLGWQDTTVLSVGKNCSILVSAGVTAWTPRPLNRSQVWLAISEEKTFICANGGPSPQHYVACFVDVATGEVMEGGIRGSVLFTNTWEIAALGANHPPRTILKYPLPEGG
jgi:hypothetical protein